MSNFTSDTTNGSNFTCNDHGNFSTIESIFSAVKIILFATAFIISMIGNIIIGYTILRKKRLWTFTNIMMVNYSAVTILLLMSTLLQFISDLSYNGSWPFGQILCKATYSFFIIAVIVSSFTITLMCYARFRAFCHPLQDQPKQKQAIYCIIITWVVGIVYMLPYSLLLTTKQFDNSTYCIISPFHAIRYFRGAYDFCLLFFTYIIPIIAVAILNAQIGYHVKTDIFIESSTSSAISSNGLRCHQRDRNIDQVKENLRRMSVIIFTVYLIVWLPFWIYVVLLNTNAIDLLLTAFSKYDCHIRYKILTVRILTKYIACFESVANIFICYYYNPPFNAAMKSIFTFKTRTSKVTSVRVLPRIATV